MKLLNIFCALAAIAAAYLILKDKPMTKPGNDFYDYATKDWRDAHPIPGDLSRYGRFDELHEENLERIKKIVEEMPLYKTAMDAMKLNADGTKPVADDLAEIDKIADRAALPAYLGKMQKTNSAFFSDGVDADAKNSSMNLYYIAQGGIGLPEREYYFAPDSAEIREKYKKHIAGMLAHFNVAGSADAIYVIEEKLAKAFYKKEKLRDPHATYHKTTRAEFEKKYKGFDWKKYFSARGVEPKNINDATPAALAAALDIIANAPLADIKLYLKWNIINSAAAFLDDETYTLSWNFYRKELSGVKEQRPRWKRAAAATEGVFGELVGQKYVKKYFPPAAKEKMERLVENLRAAYAARIEKLNWMSPATKKAALEKLAAFRVKIGYPKKWRDYSKLVLIGDSYYADAGRASEFEDAYQMAKADKPVDPDEWLMNPQEVNAYYNPTTNEICFPAGILQAPFFDMNASDAENYGAIGSIIGHEMTHGFDDEGRKFDKSGNLKDWWTADDAKNFEARARVMREFFDAIPVAPNLHANGEFTLGENLADYGGLKISATAYRATGGTDMQTFFRAYANSEATNIRDEQIIKSTKTDPHSLSRWRVNGILPHIDEWYEAFDVSPTDALFVAPEQRVRIW